MRGNTSLYPIRMSAHGTCEGEHGAEGTLYCVSTAPFSLQALESKACLPHFPALNQRLRGSPLHLCAFEFPVLCELGPTLTFGLRG